LHSEVASRSRQNHLVCPVQFALCTVYSDLRRYSPKAVRYHLNQWGIKKYIYKSAKNDIFERILEGERPSLSVQELEILKRHCKENRNEVDRIEEVLAILEELKLDGVEQGGATQNVQRGRKYQNEPNAGVTQEAQQWSMADSPSFDFELDPADYLLNSSHDADITQEYSQTRRDLATESESSTPSGYEITRQPRHFNSNFKSLEELFSTTQIYYESLLTFHDLESNLLGSTGADPFNPCPHNRQFWQQINYGIYYLKMENESLGRPLLLESYLMIPQLCRDQPFSFVKDLFSTLSVANTNQIGLSVRKDILTLFKIQSLAIYGDSHNLTIICASLCEQEGSDEVSGKVLKAMLGATRKYLPENHDEVFRLHRDLIRFLRRTTQYAQAKSEATVLISSCERLYDKNHVKSRLAHTEYMHILKDEGSLDEALLLAEDILQRGRLSLNYAFPDDRAVYTMEDIADIYDKLDCIGECINWLNQAYKAALKVWENHSSTEHIMDKLAKANNKARMLVRVTVA
jgi:hypothetical protein